MPATPISACWCVRHWRPAAAYSELAGLEVHDFNSDAGTVAIRKSKSGKARHVTLTPEGAEFFRQHCVGGGGSELMFRHANGSKWQPSDQGRPMKEAVARAKIKPHISPPPAAARRS